MEVTIMSYKGNLDVRPFNALSLSNLGNIMEAALVERVDSLSGPDLGAAY